MTHPTLQNLVEELRSTGYHGRDPWLPALDPRRGTIIAALRQLEVCASQMASPWLEEVMEEQALWSFLESAFLPRVLSLAEIIDAAVRSNADSLFAADQSSRFLNAWKGVQRLIGEIADAGEKQNYGAFVATFLVAVMVLRQLAEAEHKSDAPADRFVCESTNVARGFFMACCEKAGLPPFQASDQSSLRDLAERVASEPARRD